MKHSIPFFLLFTFSFLIAKAQIPDAAQIEKLKKMAESMKGMSQAQTKKNSDSIMKMVKKIMDTRNAVVNDAVTKTAKQLPNGDQLLTKHHYDTGYVKVQFFYSYATTVTSSKGGSHTYFSCNGKASNAPKIYEANGHMIVTASSASIANNTAAIDKTVKAINKDVHYMDANTAQKNVDIARQMAFSSMFASNTSLKAGGNYAALANGECANSVGNMVGELEKTGLHFEFDPVINLSSVGVGATFLMRTVGSSECYLDKGHRTTEEESGQGMTATTDPSLAKMVGQSEVRIQSKNEGDEPTYIKVSKTKSGFKITYSKSKTINGEGFTSTIKENLTAFIGDVETQYEAVIKPVEKGNFLYERWAPSGPKTNNSDDKKGDDSLQFSVYVRDKMDTTKIYPGNFTVEWALNDVTKYPGICNNYPKHDDHPNTDPDLKFDSLLVDDFNFDRAKISDNIAVSIENKGVTAQVKIICMDYAAWGKLKATVTLDDGSPIIIARPYYKPDVGYITIPYDPDENKLADAWEKENKILNAHYPLTWDEDSQPDQQKDNGDGYTLFEEYRGFALHKPTETDPDKIDVHLRTNPLKKDAFIYDPEKLFQTYYEPSNPSGLDWHYVSVDKAQMYYDDDDIRRQLNRWVNFNKVADYFYSEQYALVIKTTSNTYSYDLLATAISFTASEWQYALDKNAGKESSDDVMTQLTNEDNGTIDVFKSPMKTHIKIEIMPAKIAQKCALVKQQLGEAAFNKAMEANIGGSVRHEIGHCIGIRHHKPTSDSGPENCVMRYLSNAQRTDTAALMVKLLNYCKTGETVPDYIHTPRTGPIPPGEENYSEQPAASSSSDNCYGQITVKSKSSN